VSGPREFRRLGDLPDRQLYVPVVVPWIHEAGNPYYDEFFGDPAGAAAALTRWVVRPGSEVALDHVIALFEDGEPVGLIVVLTGTELASCVKVDALAALREAGADGRRALVERTRRLAGLRPAPVPDEFYISKLAVAPGLRGDGRGRALFREGLASGRRAGYRRFRVEARANDAPTIGLYESEGFRIVAETSCRVPGQELKVMVRQD
jgi:ribosomal protein S18 acetylase RimI-like enzyme